MTTSQPSKEPALAMATGVALLVGNPAYAAFAIAPLFGWTDGRRWFVAGGVFVAGVVVAAALKTAWRGVAGMFGVALLLVGFRYGWPMVAA